MNKPVEKEKEKENKVSEFRTRILRNMTCLMSSPYMLPQVSQLVPPNRFYEKIRSTFQDAFH